MPTANPSLSDVLRLAQARGVCAHPCDWLPVAEGGYPAPALYQPWVDWLSEHGFTPFHEKNTLTPENVKRWKPKPLLDAFLARVRDDAGGALGFLNAAGARLPAATRLGFVQVLAWRVEQRPDQIPLLQYFLADRSQKVRDAAAQALAAKRPARTEAEQAAELAALLKVGDDGVTYRDKDAQTPLMGANFLKTTFALLAQALGLSPQDLARRARLEDLGSNFGVLVVLTEDAEIRAIVAERVLAEGLNFNERLFRGLPQPLWERGLRATLKSAYINSVRDFLGLAAGTLDADLARVWMPGWEASVVAELQSGDLPVNIFYDPLRAMGLVVARDVAGEIVERALGLGMKADNPRLTALRFNLAL